MSATTTLCIEPYRERALGRSLGVAGYNFLYCIEGLEVMAETWSGLASKQAPMITNPGD